MKTRLRRFGIIFIAIVLVLSMTTVPSFGGKSNAPAPVITINKNPVADGMVYATNVSPTWVKDSNCQYSYTLVKQGGTTTTKNNYTYNYINITSDGTYTLTVTASGSNYNSSSTTVYFVVDKVAPNAPTISGVTNGGIYGTSVKATWTNVSGTTSTATLNNAPYISGSSITADGSYSLIVTAKKTSNNLTAAAIINFTIDTAPPSPPIITGVTEGTVYGIDVTPTWNDASGTTNSAILDNKGYTKNTAINTNGTHTLKVTVKKNSNNLTSAAIVNFTIDKVPPTPPAITGVASGIRYSSPVTPAWTDAPGTTSTATLDNNSYTKGTAISSNGSHTLVVTSTKTYNGLTASTTVTFSMDLSNGDWSSRSVYLKNTPEADLMVRVGDVDNFGFGWTSTSPTFDPFSGNSTKVHSYPWTRPTDEPAGLDKIMVVSGYRYGSGVPTDGYTSSTQRASGSDSKPENNVEPITLKYDMTGITAYNAALQLFVDDFQPAGAKGIGSGTGKAQYQVTINDKRVPELEDMINKLDQSGPIGKMITLYIPSPLLSEVQSGTMNLKFDDPSTGGADGYAIDFVKLLVNLKTSDYRGSISGKVTEYKTGRAIEGAAITIPARNDTTSTASNGTYTLNNITAGQVAMMAYKDGYETVQKNSIDVTAGQTTPVDFELKPNDTSAPMIILSQDITAPTTRNVTVTADVSDDSGIAVVKYVQGTQTAGYFTNHDTSTLTSPYSFEVHFNTQGTYTVYARDTNGNSSVRTITVNNIYEKVDPSILVTPHDGDSNTSFHVTLKGTSPFEQYKINNEGWSSYTDGLSIPVSKDDTVYVREADLSVQDAPLYFNQHSRKPGFILSFVANDGSSLDKMSLNSLKKGGQITITVRVNSSDANSLRPQDYLKFEGTTDAVNVRYNAFDKIGADSYVLTYVITAQKAGFNGTIYFKVQDSSKPDLKVSAPLKVQTISTQGIM